jgi:hypothetical protein
MKRKQRSLGNVQIQILEAVARGVGHGFDVMDETGLPSVSLPRRPPVKTTASRSIFIRPPRP